MLSRIFTAAVVVSDGKKAARWYEEKRGSDVSTVMDHWGTANPKGVTDWKIHLSEGDPEPGNTGIGFYSDDAKRTVAGLKKKVVEFRRDYPRTDCGEFAQSKNPDGNIFWISAGSP